MEQKISIKNILYWLLSFFICTSILFACTYAVFGLEGVFDAAAIAGVVALASFLVAVALH